LAKSGCSTAGSWSWRIITWSSPACSPAAGWEKGQVENQVQTIRGRFFQPRLRFASIEELNGWLEAECLRWSSLHPHPEQKELTVAEALDLERPALQPMLAPFDGFHETAHAVTGTCLISFDRNRYSVMAKAARRAVQVRAYADWIVVRLGDEVILNILARYREPVSERPLDVVVDLKLSHPPIADCTRYDTVRGLDAAA
jgi:hypothetical protein